ncbi:MAG: carboxypeptidase M32 [Chloroflexi bacterium]|nr:MAG: carboxypeptidase M32 [Chloroflexota bacterium]MBL1196777.1 carboxypeptidase M32 [Chloroflexota bacterium]NOH14071.1 carboxypeptidase M32 [Chloroflexota bacterium]
MKEKLEELKTILAEVDDISRAVAIANWDLETYMPPGGAEGRGNIVATLSRMAQETFTSEKVGGLLDELMPFATELDKDSDDARIITETKRQYEKLVKVPAEMVGERAQLRAVGNPAWRESREKSDYSIFKPHLEKMLDWVQRYADLFKPYDHIYDPLLDDYEANMKTVEVQETFDTIRPQQVELIEAIAAAEQVDDSFLHQAFEEDKQRQFGKEVVGAIGFDFERGREDKVTHPFATNLGYGDQRITVRMGDDFFNPYLFGALHEAGHGMYEQGISKDLARTSLYTGTSLGIHESQSRMWENLVGRSKPFWDHYYPRLQELFPSQLGNVSVDDFYKGINIVKPSFIRVEADEATYNLHIMLRMEIEIALLEGSLSVDDLPEYWNTKFEEYLGITPDNDADGVLQDVHWSFGLYGYFSTYALGNLISVQLWEKVKEDIPDLEAKVGNAEFKPLLTWMNEKIHVHGSKFPPQELMQRVTGSGIDGTAYISYLKTKYGDIYNL